MITTAASRYARAGMAVVGITGALTLAGCAGTTDDSSPTSDKGSGSSTGTPATSSGSTDTGSTGSSTYADGTYTADGPYPTPESVETISVTVTLEDDVITAVEVTGDPQKHESEEYQAKFIGGIADVVVGVDLDEISVSRVAGSSLTSTGFNQAIEAIKADAAV